MSNSSDHLESINQIRSIMERSTTFMSLTGLSGVMAGLFGLLTFAVVSVRLNALFLDDLTLRRLSSDRSLQIFLVVVAALALAVTLLTAFALTIRKAQQKGQTIWGSVARRFAVHLFLPLIAGGLFTIALAYQGQIQLVCPAMLLFFGLALLSAGRFVPMDMFWLGVTEMALGIVAAFWYQAGLILWAAGFGVATLVYGTLMYFKYER